MPSSKSLPVLYKGSVKEVLGPLQIADKPCVVFRFSDAFSVFDWGRMPDTIPNKGKALALMGAVMFEALESPQGWQEFSRTQEALDLRKGISQFSGVSSLFNEWGEKLQRSGLRTHYLGLQTDTQACVKLADVSGTIEGLVVHQVRIQHPRATTVLGQSVYDYASPSASLKSEGAVLIPLEVVFRYACPPGSSLIERAKSSPESLLRAGILKSVLHSFLGEEPLKWAFPIVECFTKLESTDRPLSLAEAAALSSSVGLTPERMQEMLFKTLWVAGFLKSRFSTLGFELADGKLEWGMHSNNGELMLVDAIGPDELRLLKDGEQHSKEFLRQFYRETPWYEALNAAKQKARDQGDIEWKKAVADAPPRLPAEVLKRVSMIYTDMARQLLESRFPGRDFL